MFNINVLHLIEGARQARGLTVIIDVLRAFSSACYAIDNGAVEIIPVGDIDLAYQLKNDNPDRILMGERNGKIQPGFDFGNSPSQIESVDFTGKTIIQTTSAGTQGFAAANRAEALISGSFVNADAVVAYIRSKSPDKVSIVCMGNGGVEPNIEDTRCGEYIRDILLGKEVDTENIFKEIREFPGTQRFYDPSKPWYPEKDVDRCLHKNRFQFVLRAEPYKKGLVSLKSVPVDM